jgi:hypothetical protein
MHARDADVHPLPPCPSLRSTTMNYQVRSWLRWARRAAALELGVPCTHAVACMWRQRACTHAPCLRCRVCARACSATTREPSAACHSTQQQARLALTRSPHPLCRHPQYKNGGTMVQAITTLYAQGGIPRFYSGLAPALVQVRARRRGGASTLWGTARYQCAASPHPPHPRTRSPARTHACPVCTTHTYTHIPNLPPPHARRAHSAALATPPPTPVSSSSDRILTDS